MSKFEDFGDMFNWNRELFEDDYNDGQKLVVKHKKKVNGAVSIFSHHPNFYRNSPPL